MQYRATEEIDAAPEAVWDVLVDVTQWPSWLPTTNAVRRLDHGPFGFDSAAEVRQPRLPRNVWRVTEFEPGRRFEWSTRSPGVEIRGDHLVEPLDGGRSRVTLKTETSGLLSGLLGLLYGTLNQRYITLEALSLKRRCETAEPTS
jgi:uncharacterized protein YndB with AHSA1/START domain